MVNMPNTPPPIDPSLIKKLRQAEEAQEEAKTDKKLSPHEYHAKSMTFLGMYFDSYHATKLWESIIQTIGNQIQKDKDAAVKAIRNFGKDESEQS
ncbi:MAG: hypothetical protein HW387_1659 [Parachlamydiales bacterium]|nr:hypothetical protein [Parachlamydiales bacterium]